MPPTSKSRNVPIRPVAEPIQTIESLLGTLTQLLAQISSRLWDIRLNPLNQSHSPRTNPDVGPTLKAHLAQVEGDNQKSDNPQTSARRDDLEPQVSRAPLKKPWIQTRLSSYFHAKKRRNSGHSGIGYQMQVNTKKHISKALLLSRQGNSVSAKMYAEMAQNAMREASRYMGSGEYQAFKQEVDERLLAITGARSSHNG